MAPTPESPIAPQQTQWKRKPSYKITDKNFVGAESNAVTKRLKLSSDATHAMAAKPQQRQLSDANDDNTEDSEDSEDPKDNEEATDPVEIPVETAEQERRKSNRT